MQQRIALLYLQQVRSRRHREDEDSRRSLTGLYAKMGVHSAARTSEAYQTCQESQESQEAKEMNYIDEDEFAQFNNLSEVQ
jgi:hypothetical protein